MRTLLVVINHEYTQTLLLSYYLLAETADDASNKHQSDTTSSVTHIEESIDSRKETFKKEKSVKNILDKLLPSSGQTNPIQVMEPFNNGKINGKIIIIFRGFFLPKSITICPSVCTVPFQCSKMSQAL